MRWRTPKETPFRRALPLHSEKALGEGDVSALVVIVSCRGLGPTLALLVACGTQHLFDGHSVACTHLHMIIVEVRNATVLLARRAPECSVRHACASRQACQHLPSYTQHHVGGLTIPRGRAHSTTWEGWEGSLTTRLCQLSRVKFFVNDPAPDYAKQQERLCIS
jgi:hypothetical protein